MVRVPPGALGGGGGLDPGARGLVPGAGGRGPGIGALDVWPAGLGPAGGLEVVAGGADLGAATPGFIAAPAPAIAEATGTAFGFARICFT
jgi:hypothetical protein